MHKLVWLSITFLVLAGAGFAGVTVTSPSNGSSVSAPVHVVASASSSSSPINSMAIYVDHNLVYKQNVSKVDTYIQPAAGKRYVVVQAWDKNGGIFKTAVTINVGSSSSTPSTVSTGGTWISKIDEMTGWQHCDECAGQGGDGPSTPYSMKQFVSSPSMDGKSVQFWLGGTTPYANALWWKQLGERPTATKFTYNLYFYIKNLSAAQALEFDVNQTVNGKRFIFGTECVLYRKTWDVWDTANARWIKTNISCAQIKGYAWNHLVWEFERTSEGKARFVAVTLNGVKSYVNWAYWPRSVWNASELNVAFQMDGNSWQEDYSVWLDQVALQYR